MAQGMYNRATEKARGEGLSADSQVVASYLKDDARTRSSQLVKFALDPDLAKTLAQASQSETKLPSQYRDKVTAALNKVHQTFDQVDAFDAVFAVDQHGRVVGHVGYPQANGMADFELGGYPVVADALHGFIRDDTLVWSRIYRVVARPVQVEAGAQPAGAIVGARVLDDRFARELSERTGAAVAFYVNGSRTAAGAPEGFQKSNLDQIVSDLSELENDPTYKEKGRSGIRDVGEVLSVQYTRLPGEAYDLGAGYAVARESERVNSPIAFFKMADDKDKAAADKLLAIALALGAIIIGLLFSYLEHSLPLSKFKTEAQRLAGGQSDQLHPSKFRGTYRKIASEINEGIDKVAASSGGQSRRAANLEDVLGGLPAQPQMAAFSVPGGNSPVVPQTMSVSPDSFSFGESGSAPGVAAAAPARRPPPKSPPMGRPGAPGGAAPVLAPPVDPESEWRSVYEQFVLTKRQCGEPTEGFTYEKFRSTLVRNRDALQARHGVTEVKFAVHVKAGKAALKASPVKV
jgi:hypothetical protein